MYQPVQGFLLCFFWTSEGNDKSFREKCMVFKARDVYQFQYSIVLVMPLIVEWHDQNNNIGIAL